MGRSRSRSRERERRRGRSSSRERRRARSRSRDRDARKHRKRSRSRSNDRVRDRHQDLREKNREREIDNRREGTRTTASARGDNEEDQKKARLEKLAAWKKQQEEQQQPQVQRQNSEEAQPEDKGRVWMPWEDPSTAFGNAAPLVPPEIASRQAKAAARAAEEKARELAQAADVDPLDAFMAAEVLPEVKQKEQEEAARKEEERRKLAEQLAKGKIPKLDDILEDSDEEPEPDVVVDVPHHKVKLVVGPGGERIRLIERKSKARLQIMKEEEELNRAFGSGPKFNVPKPAAKGEGEQKMTKIMIFGNSNQCEVAQRMIDEAIENKEQKQKQRHKEYERKRDAKARDRQLYHMRHTRDYEALDLPIGASRADVKAAYRRLAKLWHPDKHPDKVEEAKEKFQNIQRAYDSLMLTEEDARIEAIAG